MSHFRPKEVLHRAQESEREKRFREASSDYVLLGVHLRKKNRLSDAKKMFDRAIRLSPDSGRFLLERAACEWALGNVDSAQVNLDESIRLGLEKKALSTYLDHLKDSLQDFVELRQMFLEKWLALDRTQSKPFLEFASVLKEQGKTTEARSNVLLGLKIDPEDKASIELMETLLSQSGSPQELEFWKRFREKELNVDQLLLLLGPRNRHRASRLEKPQEELKDLKDLVAELEKELELDSNEVNDSVEPLVREFIRQSSIVLGEDYQARLDLAYAFNEMGRRREAKNELEKISSGHPLFPQAQILMGNILIQEGSDVAGMGSFQTAIRTSQKGSSEWKEAMYQLVKLQIRLGDFKQGRNLVNELFDSDPHYREVRNLRQEIELKFKA